MLLFLSLVSFYSLWGWSLYVFYFYFYFYFFFCHPLFFCFYGVPLHIFSFCLMSVRLCSLWGCVGLTVPALPSSAGLPIPTPHIYIVSRYSLCISISIRSLSLACLVCVPLSTGYGPRPDAIDDFSRQLLFFTIESFKLSYPSHPCPTLRPHTVSSFDIIL